MTDSSPEIAFLQLDADRVVVGEGPFEGLSRPPSEGSAFYWNDFELSDPAPWRVPTSCRVVSSKDAFPERLEFPTVDWASPARACFNEAFQEITHAFGNGARLEKLVPVVTERGTLCSGDLRALAPRVIADSGPEVQAYGYWGADCGLIGATPERFLAFADGVLETVALAGTAPPRERERFVGDAKQIREHALGVEGIRAAVGAALLDETPREVLAIDGLLHFLTRLCFQAPSDLRLDELIAQLHPTLA